MPLLILIVVGIVAVFLESVTSIRAAYGDLLLSVGWTVTLSFMVEYILRLLCVGRPLRYALSFLGLVDFLAIFPTYLSLFVSGAQTLIVIRALSLLRVLKFGHFVGDERMLQAALRASVGKIVIFVGVVLTVVLIAGALMYLI